MADAMEAVQKMLDSLRLRTVAAGRWGIGTAATYLRQMETGNPMKNLNCSPEEWQRRLKEAEGRLVYCAPELVVVDVLSGLSKDKVLPVRKPSVKGAIMEFEAIVSSNRKDRDGDVLEPDGAEVDPHCPLLWQHTPHEPIGKLVEVTHKGKEKLQARFAIADTALGRDAAALVEFGALRISHGFLPLEFEEIKRQKGEKGGEPGDFLGWHVKRYEMLEVSLVSVPSNVQAEVIDYTRMKGIGLGVGSRPKREQPPDGFASLDEFYEATEELELSAR